VETNVITKAKQKTTKAEIESKASAKPAAPTPRQLEVVGAIRHLTETHGYAPTLAELRNNLGIASANAISGHLKALRAKGLVTWKEGRSRTLRILAPVCQQS